MIAFVDPGVGGVDSVCSTGWPLALFQLEGCRVCRMSAKLLSVWGGGADIQIAPLRHLMLELQFQTPKQFDFEPLSRTLRSLYPRIPV